MVQCCVKSSTLLLERPLRSSLSLLLQFVQLQPVATLSLTSKCEQMKEQCVFPDPSTQLTIVCSLTNTNVQMTHKSTRTHTEAPVEALATTRIELFLPFVIDILPVVLPSESYGRKQIPESQKSVQSQKETRSPALPKPILIQKNFRAPPASSTWI